jgi:tetratricopeptide (TPR) repeat protein
MGTLFFVIAAIVFVIGLAYLYFPRFVIKVNGFIRNIFLDDSKILLNRRRYGLIYILASVIIFYFGSSMTQQLRMDLGNDRILRKEIIRIKLYKAYRRYYIRDSAGARNLCQDILSAEPNNIRAMELLGMIFFDSGEFKKAEPYLRAAAKNDPGRGKIKNMLDTIGGGK